MKVRGYRVYYIDQAEGVNDLITLIKETTAKKMALVIKNGQLLLKSSVNMKLVKKYAKKYQREIVFVNPDTSFVDTVDSAGFEIYPDLNSLEACLPLTPVAAGSEEDNKPVTKDRKDKKSNIDDNEQKSESNGFSISGLISFILILLIMATAYFYFLYPTATINIQPVVKKARQDIKIKGSTEINNIDWENMVIPVHMTEVEINGEEIVQTTGAKLIGETYATGVVKFINENKEKVEIPAGTIVMTGSGLKFETLKDVTVPALKVDYLMDVAVGMKAGQAEAQIQCTKKGSKGNINIGRITNLENQIKDVHVINPEPVHGGKDQRISLVSKQDVEKARSILSNKLKSRPLLISKVYQELGGNYRILEEDITYTDPVFSFDKEIGEPAEQLKVSAKLTARGYLIKNNELDRLLTSIFKEKLPDNMQLVSSGINVESLELEEKQKSMYNIKIGINAQVIPVIDTDNLVRRLTGRDIIKAQSILAEMNNVENFKIDTKTSTLPRLGFAIKVVITEPEEMKVFKFQE